MLSLSVGIAAAIAGTGAIPPDKQMILETDSLSSVVRIQPLPGAVSLTVALAGQTP